MPQESHLVPRLASHSIDRRTCAWFTLLLCATTLHLCLSDGSPISFADEPTTNPGTRDVDYLQQVKPLLSARCIACHGALKQEAGLRLDTGQLARKGSESDVVIVPGQANTSPIIDRVSSTSAEHRMPPEGEPLSGQQIQLLIDWIDAGAQSPIDEQPELDPREHWAFRQLERPSVPGLRFDQQRVESGNIIVGAIDAFLDEGYRQQNLQPAAWATRPELIRRLYIDLLGLPPDAHEWQRALDDPSSNWYEELVDLLLADPRHGQRWARHWMDIWRYSDWWGLGDQLRNSQLHIWHWRDWIVQSLNDDVPYDEMVRLMLAGDELAPTDPQQLRATGFLARNYFLFNRHQWMDETVEHVSKAFLGLTTNCAKCHDHKYDPISQEDYYRLRAFFEPYHVRLDMLPGEVDLSRNGLPRVFETQENVPTYLFVRGQESQPDKSKPMTPGLPHFLLAGELEVQSRSLPVQAWQPERQHFVQENYRRAAQQKLDAARQGLDQLLQRQNVAADAADDKASELRLAQRGEAEADCRLAESQLELVERQLEAMRQQWLCDDYVGDDPDEKVRLSQAAGAASQQAITAARKAELALANKKMATARLNFVQAADDKRPAAEKELKAAQDAANAAAAAVDADIKPSDKFPRLVGARWTATRFMNSGADDPAIAFGPNSSGRRTALARWITDNRNPLTARVAVNHLWGRHMGAPLLATTFDFGRKNAPPAHARLLDWLAAELIDSGWSMKHMHRLIVTSSAYRMSSSVARHRENLERDPDNAWWWHRPAIRMESEVIRDSILVHAGSLDVSHGGPPVPPDQQSASQRRSLYFFHSNNDRNLFLTTFDEAAVKECYRRDQSIVPQQALAMSNSQLVLDSAQAIAERIEASLATATGANDERFIRAAFLTLLGIEATPAEIEASAAALAKWRALSEQNGRSPRQWLVWALMNHNDFVTLK